MCAALALLLLSGSSAAHPELQAQIEELDRQIAIRSVDAELLVRRGDLYRRHGDYEAAGNDFAAARALQPATPAIDFYEGRLALEQAEPGKADKLLTRYLEDHPDHAAAWVLRGDARTDLARYREAADDYGEAITRSHAPSPALFLTRARLLDQAGSDHVVEALSVLDDGLLRFCNDVALLGMATDLALKAGERDRAAGYIDTVPNAVLALPQWRERVARLNNS